MRLSVLGLCLWGLLGLAGPAFGQDLAPALGPLAPMVILGTSGSWTVLTEQGRVVLSDAEDVGAIRFYSTGWRGDMQAGRSAGVRVQAMGMDGAAAGLVFGVQDDFPRWGALVLTADKGVVVYQRQASGLVELKRAALPGGVHPEGELLQVSQRGGVTTLFANGAEVTHFSMDAQSDRPVGILALGPGRFGFRDFAFGQAVVPQAGMDDRVPARPGPMAGGDDRVPAPVNREPAVPGTPADARRWPVPQLDPLAGNVLGATMGILAHEFGHFMIGELKLPATGPEEDVADEFAAMVFVDNMKDMPDVAGNMALSMAKFWWYTAEDRGDKGQPPWFDEHAPDRARFGRVMCMLYGAAPQMFEVVMEKTGIPERTRARCIDDERKRHAAWDQLLRSHRRRGVDPVMPGDLDPATPGKAITVEFQPPKDPRFQQLATFLQRSHMMETAAGLVTKLYVLPRNTKLVVRECGTVNCFYNSDDGSITMCYEMLSYVLGTFARHEGSNGPVAGDPTTPTPASTDAAPPAASPPGMPQGPQPTPQPAGSSMDIAQFLAGIWKLQTTYSNGVMDDILIEAMADGTYRSRHNAGRPGGARLEVGVLGRWAAEAGGQNRQFRLTLTPVQWSPRQVCNQNGQCEPLNMPPTSLAVSVVDRNTLVSEAGRAVRVQ